MSHVTRRTAPLILLALLATAFTAGVHAKATPLFFETAVVEDTEGDYQNGKGALDIVAVYLSEKFQYDSEKKIDLGEYLFFRIEVSDLSPPPQQTVRYDVHFNLGSTAQTVWGTVTNSCSANGCANSAAGGNAAAKIQENSLTLSVPATQFGIVPGMVLSKFAAESALIAGPNVVAQDQAPMDNMQAPSSTIPTTGKDYTAAGIYPFITVVPVSPLAQYSVDGSEVKYTFQFVSDPKLSDDPIVVHWVVPKDWNIAPSQGSTSPNLEGQLTGSSAGSPPRDFAFTLSSNGITNEGDTVPVLMDVVTPGSGGHVNVTTVTTITGSKIEDPNVEVVLLTTGPFTAGKASQLRVSFMNQTGPIDGSTVSIDIMRGSNRTSTVVAEPMGNGTYKATVNFPSPGTYTVDAYLSSMKPAPHQSFAVNVKGGGLAPGPDALTLVAVLGLSVLVLRRRT